MRVVEISSHYKYSSFTIVWLNSGECFIQLYKSLSNCINCIFSSIPIIIFFLKGQSLSLSLSLIIFAFSRAKSSCWLTITLYSLSIEFSGVAGFLIHYKRILWYKIISNKTLPTRLLEQKGRSAHDASRLYIFSCMWCNWWRRWWRIKSWVTIFTPSINEHISILNQYWATKVVLLVPTPIYLLHLRRRSPSAES